MEYSRDAIIIIHDNNIVFSNSAFRKIMNFEKLKNCNISFEKIQNPECIVFYKELNNFLQIMKSYDAPLELFDINKKVVFVEGRFRKIDYEGESSMLAIIKDVSEKNTTSGTFT